MHNSIFVNLPIADLDRSRKFFTDLGYSFNEDFCDGNALALVLGDNIFAMLLQRDFFGTFHTAETADGAKVKECLIALNADTREGVDQLVDRAIAAGGPAGRTEVHGFMYGRTYEDPDGHTWEIMWMDPAAVAGDAEG